MKNKIINKSLVFTKSPILSRLRKRHCLVCFKRLPEHNRGVICRMSTGKFIHFNELRRSEHTFLLFEKIVNTWGSLFVLETSKMVEVFKSQLREIYFEITSHYIEDEHSNDLKKQLKGRLG